MLISDNIYQVGYYLKEHPENTKYELFFASSDKNAMNYVNYHEPKGIVASRSLSSPD
jgi:hypothetical protein